MQIRLATAAEVAAALGVRYKPKGTPMNARLRKLYNPAAHRRGHVVLPGFESVDHYGPALPLALYQLGQENPLRRRPWRAARSADHSVRPDDLILNGTDNAAHGFRAKRS